jgi:DNA gyrase subunit B
LQFKEVESRFDEEHNLWEVRYLNSQGAEHLINWELASTPEYRQMLSKFKQIEPYMEPPFIVETIAKGSASGNGAGADGAGDESTAEDNDGRVGTGTPARPGEQGSPSKSAKSGKKPVKEEVEKATARDLFDYVLGEGKKEFTVQRYKGLGEMTAPQLWETTMDPERRTLLSVKLEDIAECETIFTTLMGEDVEARRKFIEENALDVKNLDI